MKESPLGKRCVFFSKPGNCLKYFWSGPLISAKSQKKHPKPWPLKINTYFRPQPIEMTSTYFWNGFYFYFFYQGGMGPL
jgi:hypothetical protein